MRQLLGALLLVPSLAAAQSVRPPAEPARTPATLDWSLPPIGLPLPHIGLPPANPTPTQSPPAPARGTRGEGSRRRGRTSPAVVYVVPGYGWETPFGATTPGAATPAALAAPAPVAPPAGVPSLPATGTLSLDLQPRPTGQLFVEGAYVGTLDELGRDLTFTPAGTHGSRFANRATSRSPWPCGSTPAAHLVYRGALDEARAAPRPLPRPRPSPASCSISSPAAISATCRRKTPACPQPATRAAPSPSARSAPAGPCTAGMGAVPASVFCGTIRGAAGPEIRRRRALRSSHEAQPRRPRPARRRHLVHRRAARPACGQP